MQPGNTTNTKDQQQNENAQKSAGTQQGKDENAAAHKQAEADIEQDLDLNSEPDSAADLDEGEIARLDNGNDEKPEV